MTAFIAVGERLAPRFPSALVAVAAATALTVGLGLEARGVATLGAFKGVALRLAPPPVSYELLRSTAVLALIVAAVAMMQTAATARAFVDDPARGAQVNRDFIGVGAANLLAALLGAFPVNASPPRTAVVAETGGRSQLTAAARRGDRARAGALWRRPAGACAAGGARRRALVRRLAHRARRRDDRRRALRVAGIPADPRHPGGDRRAADRAGRRHRHRAVDPAWTVDGDAGAGRRFRADSGHVDLVAEERGEAGRDGSRRQGDRLAGAACRFSTRTASTTRSTV